MTPRSNKQFENLCLKLPNTITLWAYLSSRVPRSLKLAGVTCWTKVSTSSVIVTWKIPNPKQVIIPNGVDSFLKEHTRVLCIKLPFTCTSISHVLVCYIYQSVTCNGVSVHRCFTCTGVSNALASEFTSPDILHGLLFQINWYFKWTSVSHALVFHIY